MRLTSVAVGVLLLAAGSSASALTLGRVRGAALIGQPLEILVPVTTDAGQTDGALCADADVFHGDTRIENSRVQVSVEPTAQPDTFNIRVASPTLIDEPVVTVYVRAGCSQKTSRRFVLLADFPGDSNSAPVRGAAALLPTPLVSPAENSAKSGWASANEAQATAPAPRKAAPAEKPVQAPTPKPAPVVKKEPAPAPKPAKVEEKAPEKNTAKAPASGKARLKLDPLENLAERIKTLESTTVAAPPEEATRDAQRMEQLQGDIKALLNQAAKNESNLMAMRERLEKAESERVPMFVVYALLGLVGLCLAGLAFLWTRRPQKNEWQTPDYQPVPTSPPQTQPESVLPQDDVHAPFAAAATPVVAAPTKPAVPAAQVNPDPSMDVDVNLMDLDESSFSKLMGMESDTGKVPMSNGETRGSAVGFTDYDFESDEVIDLRQQTAFFAKLGKVDDAIGLLEVAIRKNPENSPFFYLDLLDIASAHSLKTDFRQFRDEFQSLFNARIPEFALYKDKGQGLDAHAMVHEKLAGLWDKPAELSTIESYILKDAQSAAEGAFDINAFLELLAMHTAARKRHAVRLGFAETKIANSDFINLKQ